ncbi:MAG: ester cyclase [Cyclobacteriaceae bacterium]|jgi:predicted ester cyclase
MSNTTKTTESIDVLAKKGTCIEFFSAYQDFDINRMLSLCSPAGDVHFEPLGENGRGKIYETGQLIWKALMDAFPDLDNTVQSQTYLEADNAVSCSVVIFGKQKKEILGIPAKGLRFDSEHIFIFRFDDKGKIDKINISWDNASFVKQLTGS